MNRSEEIHVETRVNAQK